MNIHIYLITFGAIKPRLVSAYVREKLKGIGRSYLFFNNGIYAASHAKCARDDRVHLRKRVSAGYSGWVFIREAPAPSECTCIRVYVSGTCMPRVVDLRALLVYFCPSVCVCVHVCVRVCTHKSRCTHRTTIHRYLARPPSLGMRRDFTQHVRVMHEYSNVRIAYDASYYRLSRAHVNTCLPRLCVRGCSPRRCPAVVTEINCSRTYVYMQAISSPPENVISMADLRWARIHLPECVWWRV